jgi:hypothetical protein
MTITLYDAESGESIVGHAIGRAQDGQDKGVNKAIVAGIKYWLLKELMISTGADDTERDEHTTGQQQQSRPAQQQAEPRRAAPAAEGEMACPKCGGGVWDNRKDKPSPKSPDYKCKDKTGCDWALWVDNALGLIEKALDRMIDDGLIDDATKRATLAGVQSGDFAAIRMTNDWIRQTRARAVIGAEG